MVPWTRFRPALPAAAALLLAAGCSTERDTSGLGPLPRDADPVVFADGFSEGLDFQAFLGSHLTALSIDTGESYSFTFTQVGGYDYLCTLHPDMTGTVIVQATAPGASQVPDAAMGQPGAPDPTPRGLGLAASLLGVWLLIFRLLMAVGGKRRQA